MQLDDDILAQAVSAVRLDGYVVLENAVEPSCLDLLRERMTADTHQLLSARSRGESISGWKRGHLQQKPPHHPPFLFAELIDDEPEYLFGPHLQF